MSVEHPFEAVKPSAAGLVFCPFASPSFRNRYIFPHRTEHAILAAPGRGSQLSEPCACGTEFLCKTSSRLSAVQGPFVSPRVPQRRWRRLAIGGRGCSIRDGDGGGIAWASSSRRLSTRERAGARGPVDGRVGTHRWGASCVPRKDVRGTASDHGRCAPPRRRRGTPSPCRGDAAVRVRLARKASSPAI